MIFRRLLLPILSLFIFANISAQRVTNDKILQLEVHPSEDGKFIAKFFDKATLKVTEKWEMKAMVAEIDATNFNDLLKNRRIYPDGVCYTFYPNVKLKSETIYKNGVKLGEAKGYYENRKLKYSANFKNQQEGLTTFFYEDGTTKRIENYIKGRLHGDVKEFYENGNKKCIAHFEKGNMLGKYQSFYKNGELKRKVKIEDTKEPIGKCFDENGNSIPFTPLYSAPKYPLGFDELRKVIEKIDFDFNKANTDTSNFRIILEIDTMGVASLAKYHFKHADSLQIRLTNWVNSLARFSPAIIDRCISPSYLNISVTVSGSKVVWLGKPRLNHAQFSTFNQIEKKHSWFWEFPNPTDDMVYFIVDKMPLFPGGENSLRSYIANHIQYPKEAQKQGLQGKVYITFVVEKDGSVSNAKIAKSVHPLLNKEALRVIKHLPDFTPGTSRGKPARVSYTVPINFALKKMRSSRYSIQTIQKQAF